MFHQLWQLPDELLGRAHRRLRLGQSDRRIVNHLVLPLLSKVGRHCPFGKLLDVPTATPPTARAWR